MTINTRSLNDFVNFFSYIDFGAPAAIQSSKILRSSEFPPHPSYSHQLHVVELVQVGRNNAFVIYPICCTNFTIIIQNEYKW